MRVIIESIMFFQTIYGMSECNLIAQSPFGGSGKDEEDRMECRLSVALNTEVISVHPYNFESLSVFDAFCKFR